MTGSSDGPPERISRRSVLATGTAGLVAATAGCVNQVQSMVSSSGGTTDDTSLRIITVPADNDRQAVQIARELEGNLEALDFNVSLDLRTNTEFQRSVMLEHDFDMYVGSLPTEPDPDFLYELLHSSYKSETGKQNPFRFEDITTIDGMLREQRETEDGRDEVVTDLLIQIAREMPFIPICLPEGHRAVQPEMADLWERFHPYTRLGYFGNDETPAELTSLIMDSRPTRNVNPFSTEHRNHGTYIDLLYDSLAIDDALVYGDDEHITESFEGSDLIPWLAESIEWGESELTIRIREDCTFHDGEPLTAEDVAFTYDFLADTTGGLGDSPLPATNYRRHASTVESVTVVEDIDDETESGDEENLEVTLSFSTNRAVAEQALLIPILPKHVWGTEEGALAELDEDEIPVQQGRWSLLGSDEEDLIVGSGPFQFEEKAEQDSLTLSRFDDHFTRADDIGLPEVTVEALEFLNDTSSASALQQVEGGVADVTTSRIEPHVVEDVYDGESDETEILVETDPWSFYHVGFNTDSGLCQSPSFRNAVGRVIDRQYVAEEIFSGYAEPIWTPVANEEWLPEEDELRDEAISWMNERNIELTDKEWDEHQPFAPFCELDDNRLGQVDIEEAQRAFENAGFQYNEDGQIVDY
ncbi:ABC transporter substrate-binding protein [Halostagnicola sp. A-GB9-2]|uniref:ABC transporter substrate-binding protein n=1 Tax=Halostagnicola sp. A-GB9-2 TaxID=3048066 RepID=UPI0024C018C0|nr:ABC transporter substrate-binding protein [Halostagnicola sp. A-GB9-2]MDJ1430519.1 ABC transporter substrate-binding protein [Halostagnicola sp. A-GB9-2]